MGQFGFGCADHTDGAQSNRRSQGRCGVQVVGPRAAEREQGGLRLQQCALHMVHQFPGLVARRRRINRIQAPHPKLDAGLLGSGPRDAFGREIGHRFHTW